MKLKDTYNISNNETNYKCKSQIAHWQVNENMPVEIITSAITIATDKFAYRESHDFNVE